MLLRSAMRYYRLWIYSCNGVLLLSVIVFAVVGGFILADLRMRFVPLPLYHPTLLYGYVALLLQAGVLQAVGCVSAVRLNERWLNVYWLLMLVLLVGDVLVGIVWVFLFSSLTSGLSTHLRLKLHAEYGVPSSSDAMALWDRLQREHNCCGAQGPTDYNETQWFSDVGPQVTLDLNDTRWNSSWINSRADPAYRIITIGRRPWPIPTTCCRRDYKWTNTTHWGRSSASKSSSMKLCSLQGCTEPIRQWLQRSADLLFILGYCVIAFLKLCFLGILRYEIREMIQKIRLLQGELQALPDLATIGMPSPNHVDKPSNGNNNELEMKELTNHR
uniref:Tetraspanin9 n=1 Tax=Hemiscolopendra marginata TaxID=943146 RepID=A0A646QCJ1_9MYRI